MEQDRLEVFDDGARDDCRPLQHKESAYAYLNRSALPEAEQARRRIEGWFARYPVPDAGALLLRLQSRLDDQHRSAFFELLLHELLLCLGHRVSAIEPKLPHTWKSPDFQVESPDGHRFYLEGVTAVGTDLRRVLKRKANRYGALDLPFVIAVNGPSGQAAAPVLEGLWHGPRGPQRQGLSAVLAVGTSDPWRFAESRLLLRRNPWAAHPLPPLELGDGRLAGSLL
jgi:hypothetical protein